MEIVGFDQTLSQATDFRVVHSLHPGMKIICELWEVGQQLQSSFSF